MQKSLNSAEYQHFLKELREAREHAAMTQEHLAGLLDAHQTFVSKCESGVRRLDVVELRSWLKALGTSLTEFASRLDDRLDRHATAVPKKRARRSAPRSA